MANTIMPNKLFLTLPHFTIGLLPAVLFRKRKDIEAKGILKLVLLFEKGGVNDS